MTYKFNFNVDAPNEAQAVEKMKAATSIVNALKAEDLTALASIIKDNPEMVAMAKAHLGK